MVRTTCGVLQVVAVLLPAPCACWGRDALHRHERRCILGKVTLLCIPLGGIWAEAWKNPGVYVNRTEKGATKKTKGKGLRLGKVRLHCYRYYICLWGASERKLGKSLKPNQKDIRTNQGKKARHSAKKEATPQISGQKCPQTSWAILILRWEDQLAVLCAKANKMFMRTAVQQNVFLILNRVPGTFVTDPELIRPSIPVMTDSLDQKVVAWNKGEGKEVHGWDCWKYPSEGR